MTPEPLMLCKLLVLYMLSRVDFPLNKALIERFLLEKEYATFLTLQQAIADLIDTEMLTASSIRQSPHLLIAKEGQNTLRFFAHCIDRSIKSDIDAYLCENSLTLRNALSVNARYDLATSGEYEARLHVKEQNITLVDITLSVPSKKLAKNICDRWYEKNQEIYQYLTDSLF